MRINENTKEIISFIEKYGFVTAKICSRTIYKGFKQTPGAWEKFGYDVASETSKQMIEVVVEKEYPNFKQLPKSQQDILIKSVQNALGIIYKQNEPKISWGN